MRSATTSAHKRSTASTDVKRCHGLSRFYSCCRSLSFAPEKAASPATIRSPARRLDFQDSRPTAHGVGPHPSGWDLSGGRERPKQRQSIATMSEVSPSTHKKLAGAPGPLSGFSALASTAGGRAPRPGRHCGHTTDP